MAEEVVLLDFYVSMFGMRVRLALAEKGVSYEYREEDLSHKSPTLLQMNPIHKKIPVLIHNNKPICESRVILEYIDEVWSDPPLLPSDPYGRSQARFWADFIDQKIYLLGRGICWKTGEEQEEAKAGLIDALKLLEGELGEKPFFGGERIGIVDVSLIPFATWFLAYETFGNFKIVDHCPKLIEWTKRCMERETVAKSLADPQKVLDFVHALAKKFAAVPRS